MTQKLDLRRVCGERKSRGERREQGRVFVAALDGEGGRRRGVGVGILKEEMGREKTFLPQQIKPIRQDIHSKKKVLKINK